MACVLSSRTVTLRPPEKLRNPNETRATCVGPPAQPRACEPPALRSGWAQSLHDWYCMRALDSFRIWNGLLCICAPAKPDRFICAGSARGSRAVVASSATTLQAPTLDHQKVRVEDRAGSARRAAGHGRLAARAPLPSGLLILEQWRTDPCSARLHLLLAGLADQLPWLKQWHNEVNPEYGVGLGDYFAGFLDKKCRRSVTTVQVVKSSRTRGP